MLSGPSRKPRAPRARRLAQPPLAIATEKGVDTELYGVRVRAEAEGALWLAAERCLVVSDLHLEKGSSFAVRGQLIPPYDTRATLAALDTIIARLRPDCVISLGDSFHDVGGPARMASDDRERLCALTAKVDWIWIEGNHDPEIPQALGGAMHTELSLGALTFRHEPRLGACDGEVAGHLHPCAKVASRGRSVRARCFATDGRRMVMPAFGAYAGGLNLRDSAFAEIFPEGALALIAAQGRVWPAGPERLLPDA